jgi:hypothetical protein
MKTQHSQKIAIVVKFLPVTYAKGSRVGLSLPRFDGKRKTISYDPAHNDAHENAEAWLAAQGIKTDCFCDLGDTYAILCDWSQREAIFRAFGIPENK